MKTTNTILYSWYLLCIGLFVCNNVSYTQEVLPPNILLIITDDQGWWELGPNGNKILETPVLDQLANEGLNFTHYYAAPVCSPTRAGILTGRYHLRTGLYNTRFGGDVIDTSEITIAQILNDKGYRTGLIGKWHLGKYYGYQPNQRGFDEFFGHYVGHIEEYDFPDQLVYNGVPVEGRKYTTDLFTDAAIQFIGKNSQKPFFYYLAYNAPHSPWVVGTSHGKQERGDRLIKIYMDQGLSMRDSRIYAMVEIIDQNLGRLFDELKELGLDENTIIIFSGDNGGISDFYTGGLKGKKSSVPRPWPQVPVKQPEPFGELYDIHSDPGETVDISAQHPVLVKKLRTAFLTYYKSVTQEHDYTPIPRPVGHPEVNPVEIQSSWAKLSGKNIQYTFLGYDWDTIDSWKLPEEHATWQLNVVESGKYEIHISYALPATNEGGSITISTTPENELEFVPTVTPSQDVFIRGKAGIIERQKGKHTLKAQIKKYTGKEAMKLNRIWLKKI